MGHLLTTVLQNSHKFQVIQNSVIREALRRNRRTHIENLHEEGCVIPLKAEDKLLEKNVDNGLKQKLFIEHRIMLDYDEYKRACPSKTPKDLNVAWVQSS